MENEPYGMELILDIHDTDIITTRPLIKYFMLDLCKKLDLKPEDLHFWDYTDDPEAYKKAKPHLKGTSAVQFIMTSNIIVHSLDELNKVYVNVFACGWFDAKKAERIALKWFGGRVVQHLVVRRK